MQYGQRKLHRSVTETRRSRSGRPKVSPSWFREGAVIGNGEVSRKRTGPVPRTRTSLCPYCNRRPSGNARPRIVDLPGAGGKTAVRPRRRARSGRTLDTMPPFEFTHLDPLGRARMVDVTPKEATHRRAVARCRVQMKTETASMIASVAITKGDVLAVARVAGLP